VGAGHASHPKQQVPRLITVCLVASVGGRFLAPHFRSNWADGHYCWVGIGFAWMVKTEVLQLISSENRLAGGDNKHDPHQGVETCTAPMLQGQLVL
jgi:hypothetical protein